MFDRLYQENWLEQVTTKKGQSNLSIASLCSELVAKMAKDIGMTIRKGIVVPFLPCLVAFWGFHPYMFFHFFKCFFVTLVIICSLLHFIHRLATVFVLIIAPQKIFQNWPWCHRYSTKIPLRSLVALLLGRRCPIRTFSLSAGLALEQHENSRNRVVGSSYKAPEKNNSHTWLRVSLEHKNGWRYNLDKYGNTDHGAASFDCLSKTYLTMSTARLEQCIHPVV